MTMFNSLLSIQHIAAITSFAAAILVVAVVVFLISTSSTAEDKLSVKHKVYKLRGRYFFVLVLCIISGLFLSLRLLPYESFQKPPDETVTVVAMQWAWKMETGFLDKTPVEFMGKNEITIPVNKLVKFMVTSADVNHNFAIYNSDGVLVAQTQAMPNYYNPLEYQFSEKGIYRILCLEYCGMAHGIMAGKIIIN